MREMIGKVAVSAVAALVGVAILDAIATNSAAPNPGDPWYAPFQTTITVFADLLPFLIPVGGLAVVIIMTLRSM
jgi:type IV secretory pathway VirB2 component (pilin)